MSTLKTHRPLRRIPSVEKLIQTLGPLSIPRPKVVAIVRRELAALRAEKRIPGFEAILARVQSAIETCRLSRIHPVINGTGVLIHTNLGRAPLGEEVVRSLSEVGLNYSNLEYDLSLGERGIRASYLEDCLAKLCAAPAAAAVNNCAAALLLILRHFTSGTRKEVILSRGELVQIGGGFRIPEILETSGAQLREVGTTNKTNLKDYQRAITPETAMILRVHQSNFYMDGFVGFPKAKELSNLARNYQIPFVEDLGSGAMINTADLGEIENEPTPSEVLQQGADLVCFSGDKLLGGPQAGIIAGNEDLVKSLKSDPFYRALRCDKLILTALQATAEIYLRGVSGSARTNGAIPVIDMIAVSIDALQARARELARSLTNLPLRVEIEASKAQIGGGTLPRASLPSLTLSLVPDQIGLAEFASLLRRGEPSIVGYVSGNRFKLDLRTVFPRQDGKVINAIRQIFNQR